METAAASARSAFRQYNVAHLVKWQFQLLAADDSTSCAEFTF